MKKYFWSILWLLWVVFLSGCGSSTFETVRFDPFTFDFQTQDVVYQKVFGNGVEGNILGDALKFAYIAQGEAVQEENDAGEIVPVIPYQNTFLLGQVTIPADVTLLQFVDANSTKTSSVFADYTFEEQESKSFVCREAEITAEQVLYTVQIKDEELVYFAQYFFIAGEQVSILSFSTEKEKERSAFVSSLKSLTCLE